MYIGIKLICEFFCLLGYALLFSTILKCCSGMRKKLRVEKMRVELAAQFFKLYNIIELCSPCTCMYETSNESAFVIILCSVQRVYIKLELARVFSKLMFERDSFDQQLVW